MRGESSPFGLEQYRTKGLGRVVQERLRCLEIVFLVSLFSIFGGKTITVILFG